MGIPIHVYVAELLDECRAHGLRDPLALLQRQANRILQRDYDQTYPTDFFRVHFTGEDTAASAECWLLKMAQMRTRDGVHLAEAYALGYLFMRIRPAVEWTDVADDEFLDFNLLYELPGCGFEAFSIPDEIDEMDSEHLEDLLIEFALACLALQRRWSKGKMQRFCKGHIDLADKRNIFDYIDELYDGDWRNHFGL